MGYLHAFQGLLSDKRDFNKLLQLWEEYCKSDSVDANEFKEILQMIRRSDFAKPFGSFVEQGLPLWRMIENKTDSYALLKELIDLETTNSPQLADLAYDALKTRYGESSKFNDFIRLVGLRTRDQFQGAISHYDLLAHMETGKCLFHTGGWGTGEIIDVSLVREELTVEFENIGGKKAISFANAFKTLVPLPDDHFLAQRFAKPDDLEKLAKEDPVAVIRLLLRDMGPKTAAEIKDELCELVIPEADWSKWWPSARARIKKDTKIESPEAIRDSFSLRKDEVSHEERFHQAIHGKTEINEMIMTTYNYVRDFSETLRKEEAKKALKSKLLDLLAIPNNSPIQTLQILFLFETNLATKCPGPTIPELIDKLDDIEAAIASIEIVAFKKKALIAIKEYKKDWSAIFLSLLLSVTHAPIREYLFKELLDYPPARSKLDEQLLLLLKTPQRSPEFFFWYFQKVVGDEKVPFGDKQGQCLFLEAFLILMNILEGKPQYRDLVKKMYGFFSAKRYAVIRSVIEGSSLEFIKEFLLLVAKCQTLTDHDIKIMRSLSEVVHPSLSSDKTKKEKGSVESGVIWTTAEAYQKTKDRLQHLGTVEMVENAKEIEAARALGDLRENSEFKFALERRSRLQAELKMVSDQLNQARVITKEDIPSGEVGVGVVVELVDGKGKRMSYTILGPWDADPDKNILSFQSKLAKGMTGHKVGDTVHFRDDSLTIVEIKSYLK